MSVRLVSRLSFRSKINLGIVLILLCFAGPVIWLATDMAARELMNEIKARGAVLAENLAVRVTDSMLAGDLLRLKNMVDEIADVDDINYAFIQDVEGRVLASSYAGGFPVDLKSVNAAPEAGGTSVRLLKTSGPDGEFIYDFAAPVVISGTRFGQARLGLSRTRHQARIGRLAAAMAGVAGGALCLAVVASTLFARRVSARINALREHAEEVVRGNLDLRAGSHLVKNCWEIMQCGLVSCPAYGDAERRCWRLAGTMCPNCKDKTPRDKEDSCLDCEVYRRNKGDEIQDLAETFDVMSAALKARLEELRDAQANIAGQERLLRVILDATPDHVGLLDADLRYLAVNRAYAEFLGLTPGNIVGRPDREFFPPDEAAAREEEFRGVLSSGKAFHKEAEIVRDGRQGWYHILIARAPGPREGVALLRTDRDVTEIRRYREQLIQAQKMEAVGKLAGGVAHEINTPLGVILGYAQLLLDDVPKDAQMHEDLRAIEKQTLICRDIVADLLKFSRRGDDRRRPVSLNDTLREAAGLVARSFANQRIRLELDLPDAEMVVAADPERLKQVWINFLNNARDAIGENGLVAVTARRTPDGMAEALFADSGSGIAPENLKLVFDPFFTTKPVGGGTGLGLAVSYGIVKDYGGELAVVSPAPPGLLAGRMPEGAAPGPGSVFTAVLPLAKPQPGNAADKKEG